jgi:tetratricopeptide (TPR) repeat protein
MPIGTLIEWVWPEETTTPRNPVPTFHTYATRIRRSLERVGVPVVLVGEDGSYRLEVDPAEVDLHRFRSLMADARSALRHQRAPQAISLALEAVRLWRGRPVDDLSSERAQAWRTHLVQDEWIPANTVLLEALLAAGEFGEALARLNDLQADHAHDLSLAKLRISALRGLARSSEADAYYFSIRRRLIADGDEQAADHLRRYHENLRQRPGEPHSAPRVEPTNRPRQLLHDTPDFVGRADLLRALDLATTKPSGEPTGGVVILDGMAGVGKTALTVRWGHLARHRFPDGDFFFNLNGFADSAPIHPSKVVDDMLIALGHPPDRSLDQRSRELLLSRLLANRRTLLVLDNARNTAQVKGLIALLPSCLILVTSRQRLTTLSATTGARRVRVEPMTPAEATDLLRARIGEHRHIEHHDLARLVQLCGGLPLMITVLADHIATSASAELSGFARQLDRRQLIAHLGEDGDGSAAADSVLGWSYQRLDQPEQRLFRLLSLHTGPEIGVSVAVACDDRTPAETKRSFGILAGAHLLERPLILDRYRFHDVIRELAAHYAERDETPESRAAAERRILTFYLRSAAAANRVLYPYRIKPTEFPVEEGVEPVTFSGIADAKSFFNEERTNLTAAVSSAGVHGHHEYAWRLADTLTAFFDRFGYVEDSIAVRRVAVSSARAAGHRDGETSSLEGLGMVYVTLGDHVHAQECFDSGLQLAVEDRNEQAQATTLHHLGRLEMLRGNPAGAVDMYRRSLDVARRIDDQAGQCWTHCRIGEALRGLDQHDEALVHLFQAQWFAQRIGEQTAQATSMATIGSIYLDRGDHRAALAHAEEALKLAEAIPDLTCTVHACIILAEVTREFGNRTAAAGYARHAINICERTNNVSAEARSREVLGNVQIANGDVSDAITTWRYAADLFDRSGNAPRAALLRANIVKLPNGDVDLPTARPTSPAPDPVSGATDSDSDSEDGPASPRPRPAE